MPGGRDVEIGRHDRARGGAVVVRAAVVGRSAVVNGAGGVFGVTVVGLVIVGAAGIEQEGERQQGEDGDETGAQKCFHVSFDPALRKSIQGNRIRAFRCGRNPASCADAGDG